MLSKITNAEFEHYIDFAYELSMNLSSISFPIYCDGIKTKDEFVNISKRGLERDSEEILLFRKDGFVEGWIHFYTLPQDAYIGPKNLLVRNGYAEALGELLEYWNTNYTDYNWHIYFPDENKNALQFMAEKGLSDIEQQYVDILHFDHFESKQESLHTLLITSENFEIFRSLHDRQENEMYWNSDRIFEDLNNWVIYAYIENEICQGAVYYNNKGKKALEIFGLDVLQNTYDPEITKQLLLSCLANAKQQRAESMYFFTNDKTHTIAKDLGFQCITVAHYFCGSETKKQLIKPKRLKRGDRIAIVSLSWGGLGDEKFRHKYDIAKKRLEHDFGLEVVCMPHALRGSEFVAMHPELRAKDFMDAFKDPTISAIFCAIGGDDTIRLLPYIDFDIIHANPKIFMGYSDSTVNHFMLYKAGIVSFYGPSVMCEFGEYVKMFDYTEKAVREILFERWDTYPLLPSSEWTDDFVSWKEENINTLHRMKKDTHGYEILNGRGTVTGTLLGGCLDVFMMAVGTAIWPSLNEWTGSLLFVETSEEKPSPDFVTWTFRNLAAQGILKIINGIIVGKPKDEAYYEEYKQVITQVIVEEEKLTELPIFYNVNIGHAKPIGILPIGIRAELNCEKKTITFLECPTVT